MLERILLEESEEYFEQLLEFVDEGKIQIRNNDLLAIGEHGYNHDADETIAELNDMVDKLWYNRHMCLRYQVENEGEYVEPEIWKTALHNAQKIRDKFGEENLVFDDFEWGMLNGKISALRWVFGDEWDNLDT